MAKIKTHTHTQVMPGVKKDEEQSELIYRSG